MVKKRHSDRFGQNRAKVPQKSPTPSSSKGTRKKSARRNKKKKAYQIRESAWPDNLYRYAAARGYFFERQYQGKKIKKPLGRKLPLAMKEAIAFNETLDRGEYDPLVMDAKQATLAKLISSYLDQCAGLAPKTLASYEGKTRLFLLFLNQEYPIIGRVNDVTPAIAQDYVAWRLRQDVPRSGKPGEDAVSRRVSPKTVRTDIARLKTIFGSAVKRRWIDGNPFAEIRLAKQSRERSSAHNPLSEAEVKRLLEAAKTYDESGSDRSTFKGMMHDMTLFFLLTGLRLRELITLPWDHVDLDWGDHGIISIKPFRIDFTLHVRVPLRSVKKVERLAHNRKGSAMLCAKKQQIESIVPNGYRVDKLLTLGRPCVSDWDSTTRTLCIPATYSWRQKASEGSVPLLPETRTVIDRRAMGRFDGSPFVFAHQDHGPLRSSYWEEFKKVLKMAKLPQNYRVHDLRHTFGKTLRRRGVPLETIMGLMRHADIRETMIYAQYDSTEGAREITKLAGFVS